MDLILNNIYNNLSQISYDIKIFNKFDLNGVPVFGFLGQKKRLITFIKNLKKWR